MNRDKLKSILQSSYKREDWRNVLSFLSGNKDLLKQRLEPKEIELHTQKASKIVKKLYELGTLTTTDGVQLPIFEIELQDNIKIEYNKVGVNQLIKEYILRDAGKGAIATYHYTDENLKEWRFSFISKFGGSEFFDEVEDVETNPKKFTYIFGTPEEHRTALERLYNLEQSRFRLEDFFEAFNVEPVSNNFFKEYKNFYLDFVSHLSSNEECRTVFEAENTEDVEKDIRNFVKRLLGRIVFLYFLQKKHWLGASDTSYTDGDTDFLFNLFEADKEQFYTNWLSKLFFNALNTPDRPNDTFSLPKGSIVCVPFLNGGLFEEHQEPKAHKSLKFPGFLLEELFTFFNGYNFTIYENSPEDHIVAVDPEMLGNIFENLLEDNNDKGTFYTPKEIVHYMTQESLIEYLNTHLNNLSKAQIENLVRNQVMDGVSGEDLKYIEDLIDKVKICDPAIGSGAFPMGLLQEIFSLKAFIHFTLDRRQSDWHPAEIKQNIIQNSIYGVDLEGDAVDISRLRFWLSLVVDEDKPKPLPNLDYKIMQGNSLLESYNGIDLSNVSSGKNLKITEAERDLFGNLKNDQMNLTFDKVGIAERLSEKTEKYFTASVLEKPALKNEIDELVNEFISFNIELRENQLMRWINEQKEQNNVLSDKRQKQLDDWKKGLESLTESKKSLYDSDRKENNYFLWHLFFKDVFDEGGFDIVIGNPPYVSAVTMKRNDAEKKEFKKLYPEATGSYDLYILFLLKAESLKNASGVYSWIIPNKFLISNYAKKTKEKLINNSLHYALNVSLFDVFKGVGVYPIILFGSGKLNKETIFKEFYLKRYSDLLKRKLREVEALPDYTTIKDKGLQINSGATGFQAKQLKAIVIDGIQENSIPFTVSGNIDRYTWNNIGVKYMKDRYNEAYVLESDIIANSKWKFWKEPKIVIAGMTKVIEAVFVENPLALGVGVYGIYDFGGYNPYTLTALLNSKYYSYYFIRKFKDKHLAGGYLAINKSTIEEFPLIDLDDKIDFCLKLSSSVIHYLNSPDKISISEIVENNHIAKLFEEIIDACVFELFFKDEMLTKNINVIDLAFIEIDKVFGNKDFNDLDEQTKNQKIWELYKTLKSSEVQQRMRLFVAKSPDILKPILQS
jgi:hypothetical protein